jgi:hypothetical protein
MAEAANINGTMTKSQTNYLVGTHKKSWKRSTLGRIPR